MYSWNKEKQNLKKIIRNLNTTQNITPKSDKSRNIADKTEMVALWTVSRGQQRREGRQPPADSDSLKVHEERNTINH